MEIVETCGTRIGAPEDFVVRNLLDIARYPSLAIWMGMDEDDVDRVVGLIQTALD